MQKTWESKLEELKRFNKSDEPKISMGYTWDEVPEKTKNLCEKGAETGAGGGRAKGVYSM